MTPKTSFLNQQIESLTFFCHWSDPNPRSPDCFLIPIISPPNGACHQRAIFQSALLDYLQIPTRKKIHPIVTRKNNNCHFPSDQVPRFFWFCHFPSDAQLETQFWRRWIFPLQHIVSQQIPEKMADI